MHKVCTKGTTKRDDKRVWYIVVVRYTRYNEAGGVKTKGTADFFEACKKEGVKFLNSRQNI